MFGVDVLGDFASLDGSFDDAGVDGDVVVGGFLLDFGHFGVDSGDCHELGDHGSPGRVLEGLAEFEHRSEHVVPEVAGVGGHPFDDLAFEGVHEQF